MNFLPGSFRRDWRWCCWKSCCAKQYGGDCRKTPNLKSGNPQEGLMNNEKCQMTKECRMTNDENQGTAGLVIRTSSLIRHSSFVIHYSDLDLRISFGFRISDFGF